MRTPSLTLTLTPTLTLTLALALTSGAVYQCMHAALVQVNLTLT